MRSNVHPLTGRSRPGEEFNTQRENPCWFHRGGGSDGTPRLSLCRRVARGGIVVTEDEARTLHLLALGYSTVETAQLLEMAPPQVEAIVDSVGLSLQAAT
jgi:hypothetical protein